ncbi:indolepyruvate ferredoxin oxidoreductase subunit alpha [Patescibacteria group bacterium]|nr:indolepyruvate ferredoxin oxidoreductase subunit alpha [Patescibacteria group bacterium]
MEKVLSKKVGGKVILLGNEAIVRGALENGVQFVSTYPGTPASEIGNTFFKIAREAGVYFEFSTNEKVALEVAAGASFSGLRSLVAMKHFGLNVASDFLITLVYSGIKGGMVIMVADDPGCSSSAQSEQDSRAYSYLAHIPTLEPSTPQECKDFTKLAFEISEKFKIPIMIRETTRVALQTGPVKLGKIVRGQRKGNFIKDPRQFVTMPPRVLEMKKELLEKVRKIKEEISEKSPINKIYREQFSANSKVGVVTSGVAHLYAMEALKELNLDFPVLKLGFFYPLPKEKIKRFIKNLKKVLVVEELEPYLEREIVRFAKEVNPKLGIFGKNLLPEVNELRPEYVITAVAKVAGKRLRVPQPKLPTFSKRTPQLCPGCPYWLVFQGIKKAADPKKVIFGGEIGCYMLAGLPPHYIQDYLFCMGSSVGVGHGIKKVSPQKVIAFVGDSSFYHAGIPALINAVHNKSNPLIIIMDNQTTAMTGHQPHPGIAQTAMGEPVPKIKIEEIVQACGVKNLKIIDQIKQKEFVKTVKEFLNKKTVSVIIARRPCVFVKK